MQVIIWTPLNTSGWNLELEENHAWLQRRAELLNNYVIPSLRMQIDKDYLWFLEIREDTEFFVDWLDLSGVPVRVIYRPKLTREENNKGVAWSRRIEDIKKYVTSDYFYDVRLNSDDLYHCKYVSLLKKTNISQDTQAVYSKQGYFWWVQKGDGTDSPLNIVTEFKQQAPALYSLVYNTQKYLDGFVYVMPGGHDYLLKMKSIYMPGRQWMRIVHDTNQKIIRVGQYPSHKKYKQVSLEVLNDFLPAQNQGTI